MSLASDSSLPERGLVLFAKRECPTCTLIEPLLPRLDAAALTVFTQDDPTFPATAPKVIDDSTLEHAFRHNIETVPTLIRFEDGREVERVVGWHRADWQRITGVHGLGSDLPEMRPGCGSLSVQPGVAEELMARHGDPAIKARSVAVGE